LSSPGEGWYGRESAASGGDIVQQFGVAIAFGDFKLSWSTDYADYTDFSDLIFWIFWIFYGFFMDFLILNIKGDISGYIRLYLP
jgi:hypothetical protein